MNNNPIETQAENVIQFISAMDVKMLNSLIDPSYEPMLSESEEITRLKNPIFQHFGGKPTFLKELKEAFIKFKGNNNSFLIATFVKKMKPNLLLYKFKGNISKHYLELIFELNEDNRIIACYDALRVTRKHELVLTGRYQVLIFPYQIECATMNI